MAQLPYWMQHGGHYRPVQNLTSPWITSPLLDKPNTAPYTYVRPIASASPISGKPVQSSPPSHGKGYGKVFMVLRRLTKWIDDPKTYKTHLHESRTKSAPDEVPLRDWKAWGYYARPRLPLSDPGQFDYFKNYPSSLDVEERLTNLLHPNTRRWKSGFRHPALPPRPRRWVNPTLGAPQPFPWELQLNPFLQHHVIGSAPVCWDISVEPARVLMGYDLLVTQRTVPLNAADKAQPATYPFVTHMYINGIADFPLKYFPWPIMIHNSHGITCADVFEAIWQDFQRHVSREEYGEWNNFQRRQTEGAFKVRRGEEMGDTVRRYDVLGSHRMFRGLEPHPNLEGWMMFLGIA